MNNKTLIGIVAGIVLLGAVAVGAKQGVFNSGSACSVSESKKSACKTECAGGSCSSKKEASKTEKKSCCATK